MLAVNCERVRLSGPRCRLSIDTTPNPLPIEVTVTAKLPPGAGAYVVENALLQQTKNPEFIDEYNEPSAIIGKTTFEHGDPTAVYTFGVDKRDLTFHRHEGHRVITGITGGKGCLLKFSLCSPEDAAQSPRKFLESLYIVKIPGDRQFVLRFSGTIYHQFCPADPSENGFFAISTHTNEEQGLTGELLDIVRANQGNIALLTEGAPPEALRLMEGEGALSEAEYVFLDLE
jgi:hypothetical protein